MRAGLILAAGLAASVPTAHACGYHDPSSVSLGMLNLAYPDALYVRTAVWVAQRDGALPKPESSASGMPQSAEGMLRQMALYREIQTRLASLQKRIDAVLDGRPVPAFTIVLIGPMLWTRFEHVDDALSMAVHAPGPASEDVVIVTDAPVIAALVDGRLAPKEARNRGLLRFYGVPQSVEQVEAVFDRLMPLKSAIAINDSKPTK